MTLEAAIQENTAVLKTLITVLQSGGALSAATTGTVTLDTPATEAKGKPGRKSKDTADQPKEEAKPSEDLVAGDPSGTRYFVVTKHKTVGKVDPGAEFPAVDGLEVIGGAKYLAWKETYSKMTAKTEETKPEASADAGTGEATFEAMNTAFQKLVNDNSKGQGEGRKAGLAILAKFGVKNVQGAFALNKFDEIMGDVNTALAPAAPAAEFDPFA